ncbi:MAG: long-chain-fatty-acid--CoA ligase [Pseudomonadales bacterium]
MLLQNYLAFYAREKPEQPCVTSGQIVKTYAEMEALSNRLANGLLDLGIRKGDRIGVIGENGIEHLLMFLAAAKVGAVFVSFNYRLVAAELEYVVGDSGARILVVLKGLESTLEAVRELLPKTVRLMSNGIAGHKDLNEWLCSYPASPPDCLVDQHDPLLQLYTSGTTGHPKGVVISTFNLMSLCHMRVAASAHREDAGDCGIVCAPLFHIGGMAPVAIAIFVGQHTLLHKSFDPERIVNDIETNAVINVFMVPAMISAVLQLPGIRDRDFSNLKQISYGAAPISETLLREANNVFQCDFAQIYGMTETTGTVVALSVEDHKRALAGKPELLLSCGRPYPGAMVKVMTPEGNESSIGTVGEIWLKSPSNMQGYHNLPEATSECLTDGWVHTGDAGYMDEDGYLYLKDRIKDMVVSGAENIYPVEVENAIAKHEAVLDVAVIGVPNEKFGEALLAFIVLKPGKSITVDELITFCRDKIAGYKIPRQMELLDELPRNPSGKVLKKTLRAPYWEGRDRTIS